MTTDYAKLSLAQVAEELSAVARDTQSVFGGFNEQQLNWRPNATSWSVAQCFDHLLITNREMFQSIDAALDGSRRLTAWQRLPLLPRLFGSMLIKSQGPEAKGKVKTKPRFVPVSGTIDASILERFRAQQHEAAARVRALEGRDVANVIVVSPFVSLVHYSVLDACRLMVAHDRRHFEQARRVTLAPGFPRGS
jgi:hypothetical protein